MTAYFFAYWLTIQLWKILSRLEPKLQEYINILVVVCITQEKYVYVASKNLSNFFHVANEVTLDIDEPLILH